MNWPESNIIVRQKVYYSTVGLLYSELLFLQSFYIVRKNYVVDLFIRQLVATNLNKNSIRC